MDSANCSLWQTEADALRVIDSDEAHKLVLPASRAAFMSNLKAPAGPADTLCATLRLERALNQRTIGLRFDRSRLPAHLRFRGILMPHGFDSHGRPRSREHRVLELHSSIANPLGATPAVQASFKESILGFEPCRSVDCAVDIVNQSDLAQVCGKLEEAFCLLQLTLSIYQIARLLCEVFGRVEIATAWEECPDDGVKVKFEDRDAAQAALTVSRSHMTSLCGEAKFLL